MAENLMEKERYRWSYMNENQLAGRLKRITKPEKLRCFIAMSVERDNGLLNYLAVERLKKIDTYYNPAEPIPGSPCVREAERIKRIMAKQKGKKAKKKKEAEENIRTILI